MSSEENVSAPVTTLEAAAVWLANCSAAIIDARNCDICPYKGKQDCCGQLMADTATVIAKMIGG